MRTSGTTTTVTGNRRNRKRSGTPSRGKIPFRFQSNFFIIFVFFGRRKVGEEIIKRKRIIEREGGIESKKKKERRMKEKNGERERTERYEEGERNGLEK